VVGTRDPGSKKYILNLAGTGAKKAKWYGISPLLTTLNPGKSRIKEYSRATGQGMYDWK